MLTSTLFTLLLLARSCFCNYSAEMESIIQEISPENLAKLSNLTEEDSPEELSGQFEGDIVISQEQLREMESFSRIGHRDTKYRWPDAVVPFKIEIESYNKAQMDFILTAMAKLQEVSCVRFVPYDSDKHKDYIKVEGERKGCFSNLGRQGGAQVFNLWPNSIGKGCFKLYTIVHELMHTLGFFHMQNASDRDDYIIVNFDNIRKGAQPNFRKHGVDMLNSYDVEYDYGSVLHYSQYAFAINPLIATVVPLKPLGNIKMGQRRRLTAIDVKRINKMYCET